MNKKYDLSYPQQNIWLVENFYDSKKINSISGSLKIYKEFDADIAKKTINKFVELNDVMRIKIEVCEDKVCQSVSEHTGFDIPIKKVDMSNKKAVEKIKQEFLSKNISALDKRLFSYLILDGGEQGEIVLNVHHIISDAWSVSKMGEELAVIYDKIQKGESNFEKYPSYTEFIQKENEYTKSDKFETDRIFWREYLKGFEEPIGLKEGEILNSLKAKRYETKLNKSLENKLRVYCKENRFSPYTVFMTALAIYMERVTEKQDIVIGTPVLNRSNFAEKNMQGMFVSTMPIRFKVDENDTFLDLCKKTAVDTMTLFRHQKYPYSKISEGYKEQTENKDKLFKVMLSYQNARTEFEDKEKYEITWNFAGEIQDELEIHVSDLNNDGRLKIFYDYVDGLFENIEIKYLSKRIEEIIRDGIENNKTIETINIMPEEEKNKILYEFNNTKRPYPKDKTVIDLFEEQVEKTPNNIALVFEGKEMTYKELNEKANQVAWYLKEKGIQENEFIGITLERSEKILISIIAILKLGAAYLPIDIDYPKERIQYILENSNAKKCITEQDFNSVNTQRTNLRKDISQDDPCYVIYTSGSTGKPKGVVITHKNLMNFYNHFCLMNEFENINTILSITTICFDIFVFEAIIPLLFGKKVIMTNEEEKNNPLKILNIINSNNVDMVQTTPSKMKLILDGIGGIRKIKNIKRIVLAGEKLPFDLKERIVKEQIDVYNGYGPTETTIFSSYTDVTNSSVITIGKPLTNTKFTIRDKKNRILPLGIYGEIYISGSGVGNGYLNNNELSAENFKNIDDEPTYKSGDYGKINFNLQTVCSGRKDFQVKIHGQRVEIEEIENIIRKISKIKDVIVTLDKNNRLIAFIIKKDLGINDKYIKDVLKNKLPIYMIPSKIILVSEFIYTPNGKIDRINMLKYCSSNLKKTNNVAQNMNECERNIADIIHHDCNKIVAINESFFEAGLDSFDIIRLSSSLSNAFNKEVLVREIINSDNIENLAKLINKKKEKTIKKCNTLKKNNAKLTSNQKGIFTNYVMNTEALNYNIPFEIKFDKKIDCLRLKNSIEKVINSIPNIFGHIEIENSNIVQKIDSIFFKLEIQKISNEEYEIIRNNFVKPFDLLKGPLFDIKMYETETNIFILLDFHHIIFDGASISMLMDRIKENYETGKLEKNIVAQRKMYLENDPKYIEAKKYFLDEFSGELPINDLPLDYKRPNEKSSAGDNIIINIDEKLTEKINKYSKVNNVTINSIFLSAFNILLSKYMYSEDIIVGVTALGRNTQEELNTIGMFVKTIPFRTNIDYEKNTPEFVSEIQNHLMMSIENDIYSYDDLIKDLKLQRDPSRNPLFDILYTYQNKNTSALKIEDNIGYINPLTSKSSKFDFTCQVENRSENIQINMEYCSAIISKSMANDFTKHYINIIKNIIEKQSSLKLKDIDMILDDERDDVLNIYNNTKTNYPIKETATRIFEKNVLKNPEKTAVVFENKKLTYKELNEKANQIAHLIIQRNIKEGSTIAIMIDKSIEFMIGALGALKANCVYMPMDKSMPDERIKFVLEDSATKLIITTKEYYKQVSDLDTIFIDIDNKEIFDEKNKENLNLLQTSDKPAYIIYTSGSTGKPKGNIIIHKGIVRLVLNTNYLYFLEKDVMMVSGSLTFDTTIFEIWGAMLFGMTLHFISKDKVVNPVLFKQYILKNNITTGLIPTPIFNQLVEYDSEMFKHMHQICVGGDTFMAKYSNQVFEKCPKLILTNVYGPAENAVICTANIIEKKYDGNIPIGKVTSNSTCYVVDKCDNLCPPRVPGELYVGGDGLGLGYLNRDELTKEKFTVPKCLNEKIYKTGDLTSWNKDGTINFKGRIDFQIKIRGQRIEITEIQNKMLEINEIKEVVILALDNNLGNKYLVAYYTLNKPYEEKDIEEYLRKYLPIYMIPTRFVLMKEMPLNQNGKIDRKALPIVNENIKIEKVDPQNEEQEKLLNLYRRVLNNNNFFMTDNFFEKGGDSLIAMNLAAEAANEDVPLVYGKIFDYPTPLKMYNEIYLRDKHEDLQKNIDNYDYSKINDLLGEKAKIIIPNKKKNILLTGTPGFLGSHILDNLLSNTDLNVYCLVRRKDNLNPKERLKERLHFFFGKKYDKEFDKRIKVIEGDLTIENLFVNKEDSEEVVKNVGIVINTAAYVKHYGKKEIFESININGVNNLAKFSDKNGMKFVHISTLSVSGNMLEAGQIEQTRIKVPTSYTEKDLYIGQELNNIYAYSKFIAERNILEKMISSNLNAIILRVGNLTGRYSDGTFQPNVEENAFVGRIKSFINLESVAKKMVDMDMEFTPIDLVADAVVRLATHTNKQIVYHVYNSNHAKLYKLIDSLEKFRIKIKILEDDEQKNRINELLKDKQVEKINGILIDINSEKDVAYFSNIHIDSKETIIELKKVGFSWPIIEQEYIDKYFKYLRKIKFI